MFALFLQDGEKITGLSKYPVIAMFLFLILFIAVTVYTFTADKKDIKEWSELPLEDEDKPKEDN